MTVGRPDMKEPTIEEIRKEFEKWVEHMVEVYKENLLSRGPWAQFDEEKTREHLMQKGRIDNELRTWWHNQEQKRRRIAEHDKGT